MFLHYPVRSIFFGQKCGLRTGPHCRACQIEGCDHPLAAADDVAVVYRQINFTQWILRQSRALVLQVILCFDKMRHYVVLDFNGWEAKRLKGCIFSPPSLLPVSGRGKEARKCDLSIATNPVSVLLAQELLKSQFYGRLIEWRLRTTSSHHVT